MERNNYPASFHKRLIFLIIFFLIGVFAYQSIYLASHYSLTNDEGKHLVTGWWHLNHRHCCLGRDNSPLTAYFSIPFLFTEKAEHSEIRPGSNAHQAGNLLIFQSKNPWQNIFLSRCTTILAGIILLITAFCLTERLFGRLSGFITLGVLVFDPNIIAHFSLISTDALLTTTIMVFFFLFDTLMRRPKAFHAILAGISLGLAFLTKFTALVLIPGIIPILLLYYDKLRTQPLYKWLKLFSYCCVAVILTVWIGYGFHYSSHFPFLEFPGLIEGFSEARGYATNGMVSFFNGEVGRHWTFYFVEALAIKTPIPILLLWAISISILFFRPVTKKSAVQLVPIFMAAIFFMVMFLSKLNIGIRHILPIYPLMAVSCGSLARSFRSLSKISFRIRVGGIGLLMAWMIIETIRIFPFQLSYFNQIAGGPIGGMNYLGDSNLDWGQDLGTLKKIMDKHDIEEVILAYVGNTDPAFFKIKYQYLPLMFFGSVQNNRVVDSRKEIIAVSTNNLQGFLNSKFSYNWLLSRKPIAMAGYSIYLYDITGDAQAHRHLANIYFSTGLNGLALKEMEKVSHIEKSSFLN